MSMLFDDVSRIIASPVSRRKALRLVGEAVGGAVLASLGLGMAFGDENDDHKIKCRKGQKVCEKRCCNAHETCCDGKCCDNDEFCCDGRCVDKRESKNGRCPKED
jgi:hypothetical protein